VLVDGKAGELLEVDVVVVLRHVRDAAHQWPAVRHGFLLRAAGGGEGEGEGEGEQGSHESGDSVFAHLDREDWGRRDL
jgi:hypothetical protein